jgi:hypothetical protein
MIGKMAILCGLACGVGSTAWGAVGPSTASGTVPGTVPGTVIVHSKFGGQIFGFDIDQAGTEGVLSEASGVGANVLAAVETFDQATGKILSVVQKIVSKDDFLTLGVMGGGLGLVEREHVKTLYVAKRIYNVINPLGANQITGTWTPKLKTIDIPIAVGRNQDSANNAFLVLHNKDAGPTFVFGANVAAGTEGPHVKLQGGVFGDCCVSPVGYDSATNQAVVAGTTGAVGGPPPVIAVADLTSGKAVYFNGLPGPEPFHAGFVNGLAVDSDDGIACTTTELDARVEFYNLKKKTGTFVTLPGQPGQLNSGSDVEYDPVHKWFFVAQSVSTTGPGSSIQVYDLKGNLVESLNGFSFSNSSNVIGTHVALNPATRTGYVDGPSGNVNELQQFSY